MHILDLKKKSFLVYRVGAFYDMIDILGHSASVKIKLGSNYWIN